MRILLTSNAYYAPPKGGSTRSNLVWLAHLVNRGHECLVVSPGDDDAETIDSNGVRIKSVRDLSRRTTILRTAIEEFRPDWVLVSSEDVTHVLLREAHNAAPDRIVYLAHTPQFYPFGPASWHQDTQAASIVKRAAGVIAIGEHMAGYIRQHLGRDAMVVHPPMYGEPPFPRFTSPDDGWILMINPSVVKGISIFLALADRFPEYKFAGLAGWATTSQDREQMRRRANVTILESLPKIDDALSRSRLLLMPSIWYEGFGLIAMEAMLRGLPVISSDSGGLQEAKRGTSYVIPVRPIERYEPVFDETHMPKAVEVEQDIEPWVDALKTLLTDRSAYLEEAERSRTAATEFVSKLSASDFEHALESLHLRRREKMRILLAHNSTYYPSHGGGDKSNRLLMEALAERGHDVRVVTRVERFGAEDEQKLLRELSKRGVRTESQQGVAHYYLNGVDIRVLSTNPNLRGYFSQQISEFDPDIIVTSTDDPGQLLFDLAIRAQRARVVYLIRATIAVPFGPESSSVSSSKTGMLQHADAVVTVSHYVAGYARQHGGLDAVHVPISLLDKVEDYPYLASFENRYVAMVNPCAVKGIGIFLELADRMPGVSFAAVPSWGTTADDLEQLAKRGNVSLIGPYDDMDDLLRQTKVMLVPSVWAEARSRLLMESMSRGVPVLASDVGGLHEAHLGVDYLIPVNPVQHYKHEVDSNMVPVAEVPPQNVGPWAEILNRLLTEREHWEELSKQSRDAALEYARNLNVLPFERILKDLLDKPKKPAPGTSALSDDKRKLLALRLKQRAAAAKPEAARWLAGIEEHKPGRLMLVCFPYAGGGTLMYRNWREALKDVATVCAVRLPGRESRFEERPIDDLKELIDALDRVNFEAPFAFFGHSMGAAIAFELIRRRRQLGRPLPKKLIVSAARAPQFRLRHQPPPEPSEEDFIEELRRLEGMPNEVLAHPELMRLALPPMRADARLYRNYVYQPGEPFDFQIVAYGGDRDPNVTEQHLLAWREQTRDGFRHRQFKGGHFYLQSDPGFSSALANDLR